MAEDEDHHHPHRNVASARIRSASNGSISQVNVNVSELDAIFNSSGLAPTTTTISTIAVQAGEARIVLAILRVGDARVRLRTIFSSLFRIECGNCSSTYSTNGTRSDGYWFNSC